MTTALITGASSGIGLELARVLAREGIDLVLVARTQSALQAVGSELSAAHGITAHVLAADLSDPAAPDRIVAELTARGIALDILINNAGFGLGGRFAELPAGRQIEMVQVNVTALTSLTRLVLPGMLERRRGRIMNVASTAAFQPGPLMAVYYASKAYVLSFSEAVAEEVQGRGVTVTVLCPGPTRTNFARVARGEATRHSRLPWVMSARQVAEYGYRAMLRGKRVAIPGLLNRLAVASHRLFPRIVSTKLAAQLQKRVKGIR